MLRARCARLPATLDRFCVFASLSSQTKLKFSPNILRQLKQEAPVIELETCAVCLESVGVRATAAAAPLMLAQELHMAQVRRSVPRGPIFQNPEIKESAS